MPSSVPPSTSPPRFEAFNATSLMCLFCWTVQQNNVKLSHKIKIHHLSHWRCLQTESTFLNWLSPDSQGQLTLQESAGLISVFLALSPISLRGKNEWLMKEIIIWPEMRRVKSSHLVPKFCVVSCCILSLIFWPCDFFCLKKTRTIGYHYSFNSSFEYFWFFFFFFKWYNLKCVTLFELSFTFFYFNFNCFEKNNTSLLQKWKMLQTHGYQWIKNSPFF